MSWDIIAIAFFRIALMLVIFLLLAYCAVQLLKYRLSKQKKLTELNWSGYTIIIGILAAIGLLVNEMSGATISTVKFLQKELDTQQLILAVGKYLIVFLAITMVTLIISFFVNLYLFKITTKKKLFSVLSENQIPDALYFTISLIIISWLVCGGLGALLDGFVPYPTLPYLN